MRIGILKHWAFVLLAIAIVADASSKSSSNGGSSSLRRIKKEYKDAVDMGIAYDWVKQRHIKRKDSRKKTVEEGENEQSQTQRSNKKSHNDAIICLGPITSDIRQWHFSFRGAGDGVYSKGIYHGVILLPKDYPLSPPSVSMWTPSGRFVPQKSICLTASEYHPETWTPRWSIHGIVNALRLHMLTKPDEIGGMTADSDEIIELARQSLDWKVTWTQTNANNKKTRITVDHGLLLKEGVLSLGPETLEEDDNDDEASEEIEDGDEELEEENPSKHSSSETTHLSHSDSDMEELAAALKEKIGEIKERTDIIVSKKKEKSVSLGSNSNKKKKKRISKRTARRTEMIASILQLAILYMVVLLFLNK